MPLVFSQKRIVARGLLDEYTASRQYPRMRFVLKFDDLEGS